MAGRAGLVNRKCCDGARLRGGPRGPRGARAAGTSVPRGRLVRREAIPPAPPASRSGRPLPMRILAVETSTLAGGVAALEGERVVGESLLNVSLTHSERLMAMVDRLLVDCGWTLDQLDGLAVSVGPGSFTGLRVGIAAVKGLAFATGLPVAAVPTLDALAAALPFSLRAVCPVLDARKGEVYVSLYRWMDGTMARRWDYLALPPAEAAARIESPAGAARGRGGGVPRSGARGRRRVPGPAGPAAALSGARRPARSAHAGGGRGGGRRRPGADLPEAVRGRAGSAGWSAASLSSRWSGPCAWATSRRSWPSSACHSRRPGRGPRSATS